MLSCKQAWLFLAGLWDKAREITPDEAGVFNTRTGLKVCVDLPTKHDPRNIEIGICDCLGAIQDASDRVLNSMYDQLNSYRAKQGLRLWDFWFPLTMKGAKQRAALCRKFAEECDED